MYVTHLKSGCLLALNQRWLSFMGKVCLLVRFQLLVSLFLILSAENGVG